MSYNNYGGNNYTPFDMMGGGMQFGDCDYDRCSFGRRRSCDRFSFGRRRSYDHDRDDLWRNQLYDMDDFGGDDTFFDY